MWCQSFFYCSVILLVLSAVAWLSCCATQIHVNVLVCCHWVPRHVPRRKGQATNEMLFGGVSLGEGQQESLEVMTKTAERGIEVDLKQ